MNRKFYLVCVQIPTKMTKQEFELLLHMTGEYIVLMENVYLLIDKKGEYNSETLRDKLSKTVHSGGIKIFVMKTSLDAAWLLEPEINGRLTMTI